METRQQSAMAKLLNRLPWRKPANKPPDAPVTKETPLKAPKPEKRAYIPRKQTTRIMKGRKW